MTAPAQPAVSASPSYLLQPYQAQASTPAPTAPTHQYGAWGMMVVDSPSVAAALQTPALQESYMVPLTPEGYRDFDNHRPAILASASGVTAAARTYPRGFPTLDRPGIDPNAPPADLSAYLARQEATVQPSDVRGGVGAAACHLFECSDASLEG